MLIASPEDWSGSEKGIVVDSRNNFVHFCSKKGLHYKMLLETFFAVTLPILVVAQSEAIRDDLLLDKSIRDWVIFPIIIMVRRF